jgi:superfamily I DNA/RNA helicase
MAFTRRAANEARERAAKQFGLKPKDLPFFSTLHSMAYRQLGATGATLMGAADYNELGDLLQLQFTASYNLLDGPPMEGPKGSRLLQVIGYARSRHLTLEQAWHHAGEGVSWWEVVQLDEALRMFKRELGKRDFHDLIDEYAAEGAPLPVKLGIIDEAQDLTVRQWQAVHRAFGDCPEVVVAGDDDQAIYRWSGASVETFLRLAHEPGVTRTVLDKSHRLPRKVFDLANRVSARIRGREPKVWKPADREGRVEWIANPGDVDLTTGNWLLLARNSHYLKDYAAACRLQGVKYNTASGPSVPAGHLKAIQGWEQLRKGKSVTRTVMQAVATYNPGMDPARYKDADTYGPEDLPGDPAAMPLWHDALQGINIEDREYYLTILRRGERLQDPARVTVGTVHSAKGGQASNVVLRVDMTARSYTGFMSNPDDEARVFYTGMTRAQHNLFLVAPQGVRFYPV